MAAVRSFAVFLLLIHLIMLGECNEKIYDTFFNGHCFWSEEVAYHVHYASGCKVYFTCQRGKFLDFKRCPESTIFNTETLQCDANGICEDNRSANPAFDSWWKKVVEVIDDVLVALESDYTQKEHSTSTFASETSLKKHQDVAVTVPPSQTEPTESITKDPIVEDISSYKEHFSQETDPKMRESTSSTTERSTIKDSMPSDTVANKDVSSTESSHPTPSAKHTSVHIVPMQFDTVTTLLTENFSSYVTPNAILDQDLLKLIEEFNLSSLESNTSNSTNERNVMRDIILPVVKDILNNSTLMSKVTHLFKLLIESADPIVYQILDQKIDDKMASSITFSLKELKEAWNRTTYLAYPIYKDLALYIAPKFLRRAADETEVVIDIFDVMFDFRMPSLIASVGRLLFKYPLSFRPSASDRHETFTLLEIRKDLKSVCAILKDSFP